MQRVLEGFPVEFVEVKSDRSDSIALSTGCKPDLSFLDDNLRGATSTPSSHLFRHLLHRKIYELAFIAVRHTLGTASLPLFGTEARWNSRSLTRALTSRLNSNNE